MNKSKNLFRRGRIFYLRFKIQKTEYKVSLQTDNLYEAIHLRDKMMEDERLLLKMLESKRPDLVARFKEIEKNSPGMYKRYAAYLMQLFGEEVSGQKAINARRNTLTSKAIERNDGIPNSFVSEIDEFLDDRIKIKDQNLLETLLKRHVGYIEEYISQNGGVPSDLMDDFQNSINPVHQQLQISDLDRELIEQSAGCFGFIDPVTGEEHAVKDFLEFKRYYEAALYKVSRAYCKKYQIEPAVSPRPKSSETLVEHKAAKPCVTFCEVIDKYITEKEAGEDANENTVRDIKKYLQLAMEFFGSETDINEVNNRDKLLEYKSLIKKLPPNRNKGKLKDMAVRDIAEMDHKATMKLNTYNKYLRYLNSVLVCAERNDIILKTYSYELCDKNKTSARSQNDSFSSDDLVMVFSYLYQKYYGSDKQEKFWIPLIALFTSCRLNEACQFTPEDIKHIEGVLCFDITNETDDDEDNTKAVKNENSKRTIPIHKTLLALGLKEFFDSRKVAKNANIWGLTYRNSKDKYSRTVGRSFSDARGKAIIPKPKPRRKTFHSLRHTFASEFCKYTQENVVAYCMGHSTGSETFDRYTKYDDMKWLKEEVDKLVFPEKVEVLFQKWIEERQK